MASHVGRALQTRILRVMALLLVVLLAWWPLPAQASPDGAVLFENHCAGCHVHGGNIIRRGKTLRLSALERQGWQPRGDRPGGRRRHRTDGRLWHEPR